MNTKTIQHIKDLINQGHWVKVNINDRTKIVFIAFNEVNEYFVSFGAGQYSSQYLQDNFTNEYKVVTRPPTGLKVGDLVEILDTPELRELFKDSPGHLELIGENNNEVRNVHLGISVTGKSLQFIKYSSPYWAVAKCLPEEKIEQLDNSKLRVIMN